MFNTGEVRGFFVYNNENFDAADDLTPLDQ